METNTKQQTVFNKYTKEELFEGTLEECQNFIGSYGGGWTALGIKNVSDFGIEAMRNMGENTKQQSVGHTPGEVVRLIRFDEWKEKRLSNWNPHSVPPPDEMLRDEWFKDIDKQYKEVAKAVPDLLEALKEVNRYFFKMHNPGKWVKRLKTMTDNVINKATKQ